MQTALCGGHRNLFPKCSETSMLMSHSQFCRNPAKMELVRELAMDGILYMPGPDTVDNTTDISKGASLNRVLRKIYPRGTEPKATDLVAFFDDDQVSPQLVLVPAQYRMHTLLCVFGIAPDGLSVRSFNRVTAVDYIPWKITAPASAVLKSDHTDNLSCTYCTQVLSSSCQRLSIVLPIVTHHMPCF